MNDVYVSFPQKEQRTVVSKPSYSLIKMKRISFFIKKEVFKKKKDLNLNYFNIRNAITKRRFSSYTLIGIICRKVRHFAKIVRKKKIKNEIRMIFSCDKYDKIRRKTLNGINKVHKINLQTRKKEQN